MGLGGVGDQPGVVRFGAFEGATNTRLGFSALQGGQIFVGGCQFRFSFLDHLQKGPKLPVQMPRAFVQRSETQVAVIGFDVQLEREVRTGLTIIVDHSRP